MRIVLVVVSMMLLASTPVFSEVNLPPGFEIVEFAVNDYGCTNADINDCGQIAYSQIQDGNGASAQVFVYDNGQIVQVTYADWNVFPYINNSGQMIWGRGVDFGPVDQLIFFDGLRETLIDKSTYGTNGDSINDLGHVAFARTERVRCPRQANIFVWDGVTVSQVTFDSDLSNVWCSLNNRGELAWAQAQFCDNPWHSEIVLRTQRGDEFLTSPNPQNEDPQLADSGDVVWASDIVIEMLRQGELRYVTDHGASPRLNSHGRVYVPVYDESEGRRNPWAFDVRDRGIQGYRFADGGSFGRGAVNDAGEVVCVWDEYPSNRGGVLFLRRIRTGDSEFDGDIDLRDHKRFARGMTGPVRTEGLCEDRFLDMDYDGDLDLADYAKFQNAFTGTSP